MQRHLQLRIEAQGKYLQSVLEKAQETLGGQNMGTIGIEAAKVQLSDLASKVSTQCLNSAFPGMKQLSDLCQQQQQQKHTTDCSIDSCLTSSCDQELYNNLVGLKPVGFRQPSKENEISRQQIMMSDHQLRWRETNSSNLSIGIGVESKKWSGSAEADHAKFFSHDDDGGNDLMKVEKQKGSSSEMKLPFFSTKLDLNTDDENDAASSCKQLDLNGFSWS